MEYCCHVLTGAASCISNFWISDRNGYAVVLVLHLRPLLAHRQNLARLSVLYRYYFGRCSSELAQLIPIAYSRGRSTRYSDRLHNFSVTIPRSRTANLWNSLPIEYFPLTCDLSGFRSKVNRYLLTVGSF